ncbi:MAG TPA: LEA type 2 family protein [Myxococcales bacterium]|nr:LEA type 2 family protein [Myxococcales bacterium]
MIRPSNPKTRNLLVALPLLCSCSLLQQVASSAFQRPTLSFKDARLPHIDFQGAELDLVFDVTNPNSMGLDLTSASYALEVEGHKVASGTPQNGLKIPAGGTTEVTFPAKVRWNEIAPALEALFAMDQVHYKASGELGVGGVTLPLAHEGTFAPPKMPRLDVGSPQITSLSLTGARLSLPLKIANLNGFPLPLGGILGTVDLAGARVGRVDLQRSAPVPSKGETTVNVPLDLSFLSTGQAVAEALRTGVAEVKVDAMLNAGGAMLPLKVARTVQLQRASSP